jgi:arylsulfatase A
MAKERRDKFISEPVSVGLAALAMMTASSCSKSEHKLPNFVIIFTDDQGYNDLSCYGSSQVNTPNIDRMAAEGVKLTSFYVAAPLSTPSRAALMTGSYPRRVGLPKGSRHAVLLSNDIYGLNPDEITLAEVLKKKGYATAIYGKWHLGDQKVFLPTRQGFDEFFGLPYSHDIHPYHPNQKNFRFPPLPLYEGEKVIELEPDMDFMTKRLTDKAVDFIGRHRDTPFFLYLPHPMPHAPLHVSPEYYKSVDDTIKNKLALENGYVDYDTRKLLFPQVINEIDYSVGEILKTLKKYKLDKNTLVIFTSDNGPYIGSAAPLRGKKGSRYEGGVREPAIFWWPGKIPSGSVSDQMLSSMDIYPTLARLAGAQIPDDRIIDGKDIWPVLSGEPGAVSPHDRLFYHVGDKLVAVRAGKWKLHRTGINRVELYDLENDISEQNNVATDNPDIVKKLGQYLDDFENEMTDSLKIRPVGNINMFPEYVKE